MSLYIVVVFSLVFSSPSNMPSQSHMFADRLDEVEGSGAYTPITAAIIARPTDPVEWLPIARPPIVPPPFEPRYKLMSARERKQMDLRGESGSTESVPTSSVVSCSLSDATPVHRSNRRLKDDDLLPATRTWACNTPVTKSITSTPASAKRRTTDLIPTTQPWASPAPAKAYSPLVTGLAADPRRQANDLIPATMPWVTPYVTPSERGLSQLASSDHRRRKGITDENFPKSGSIFDTPIGSAASQPERETGTELTRWKIGGVRPTGNEEEFVKKLLTTNGVHVVKAKADIDIVSNRCNGTVEVFLRSAHIPTLERVIESANLYLCSV